VAYRLAFDDFGWEDYLWRQAHDRKTLARINRLIVEICRTPFEGTGKPEALKYGSPNTWSRRITQEHRLVYRVVGSDVVVLQTRYHYGD